MFLSQLLLSFLQKPAELHCRCCEAACGTPVDEDQTSQKTASFVEHQESGHFLLFQITVKGVGGGKHLTVLHKRHTQKKILV